MIRVMVTRAGDEPRLHTFEGEAIEVGSAVTSDLRLNAPGVSKRHFRLVVGADGITITDLGSSNGTYVHRERLAGPRILRAGDPIDIPGFSLTIVGEAAAAARQPATPAHGRATSGQGVEGASPAAARGSAGIEGVSGIAVRSGDGGAPSGSTAGTGSTSHPATATATGSSAAASSAAASLTGSPSPALPSTLPSTPASTPPDPALAPALVGIQAKAQAWFERPDQDHLLRGESLRDALTLQSGGAIGPREAALVDASVAADAQGRRARWWVGLTMVGALAAGVTTSQVLLSGGTGAHARSLGAIAADWGARGRAELRGKICRARARQTTSILEEQAREAADEALRRASDDLECAPDVDGEPEIEGLKDAVRGVLRGAYGPVIAREASPITGLSIDPSGCHVAWGRADGALRRWDRCDGDGGPETSAGAGAIRALRLGDAFGLALDRRGRGPRWAIGARGDPPTRARPGAPRAHRRGDAFGLAIDRRGRVQRWAIGASGDPPTLDLTGVPAAARALAVSEDQRRVAFASDDGRTILLYDLDQGAAPTAIGDLAEPASALAFTPSADGLLAAQGAEVGLWPLKRGRPGKRKGLLTAEAPIVTLEVETCATRPGARDAWVLVGDEVGAIAARPLASKARAAPTLRGLGAGAEALALTRECRHVLGAAGRSLFVWDLSARDPSATPRELRHERPITALALGDDADTVITAAAGEVSVWDLSRPADPARRLRHPRALVAMDMVRGTGSMIAAFEDGSVRHWDLGASTAGAAATLVHHPAVVRAAAIDREGARMISAAGRSAFLWQLDGAGRVRKTSALDGQAGSIAAATIREDGLWAATVDEEGQLLLWSLAGAAPSAHPFTVARGARRLAFTERHLVVIGSRGACSIGLADLEQRRCQELPHAGEVSHVAVLPGTPRIALGGASGALSIVDLDAHARGGIATTTLPKGQGLVTALAVSGDGRWLAAASEAGELRLWRLDRGAVADPEGLRLGAAGGQIYALALAADGGWLAVAGEDRTIRLFRPGGGPTPEAILEHGEAAATALAFTRVGLLSGSAEGTLLSWAFPQAGASEWTRRNLGVQPGTVRQILVGDGEDQAIVISDDPSIHVWPLSARALASIARRIAGPP